MAFNYLTWQDSGAPTLTGQAGSLTNNSNTGVLDWALVTKGGWTKSQTAANASVFTPVTGNTVLLVIDDATAPGNAKGATVRGGESASGTTSASLTNPFPTVALVSDGNSTWTKSATADSTQRPYIILVTDSFVFVWFGASYSTSNYNTTITASSTHCYGQFSKAISSDSYNTCLSVANAAPNNSNCAFTNAVGVVPTINTRFWGDRTADGSVFSPCLNIIWFNAASAVGNAGVALPAYPNGLDNKLHVSKLSIADTYAQSGAVGSKSIECRGWLPNIWGPMEGPGTIVNYKTFVDSSYNGGALFQYLADSTGSMRLVLETTNTWAAPGI
jgi:hypothetical protein